MLSCRHYSCCDSASCWHPVPPLHIFSPCVVPRGHPVVRRLLFRVLRRSAALRFYFLVSRHVHGHSCFAPVAPAMVYLKRCKINQKNSKTSIFFLSKWFIYRFILIFLGLLTINKEKNNIYVTYCVRILFIAIPVSSCLPGLSVREPDTPHPACFFVGI